MFFQSHWLICSKKCSQIKIKSIQINDIDVIIPVPETSLIFALGLQSSLKVKMQYGLVKNSYIERTFIMKDDKIIKKNKNGN